MAGCRRSGHLRDSMGGLDLECATEGFERRLEVVSAGQSAERAAELIEPGARGLGQATLRLDAIFPERVQRPAAQIPPEALPLSVVVPPEAPQPAPRGTRSVPEACTHPEAGRRFKSGRPTQSPPRPAPPAQPRPSARPRDAGWPAGRQDWSGPSNDSGT